LALTLLAMITTILFLENFRKWERAVKKINYRNREIVTAGGVVFVIVLILAGIFSTFYRYDGGIVEYAMLAAVCIGFSGLMDDVYGTCKVKGLKGHFSELLRGKITTGNVKAIMGLCIAAFLSVRKNDFGPEIIVDTLVIALSTNLLNLMDLRPGRACKFFLFSAAPLLLYFFREGFEDLILYFLPLVASVLIFLFYDSRELMMMGDVGSNVLGVSLGTMIAWCGAFYVKIGVLIFLIVIHILAEFYSISEILEKWGSAKKR